MVSEAEVGLLMQRWSRLARRWSPRAKVVADALGTAGAEVF